MGKQFESERDYAACVAKTPLGQTPECFKGWAYVDPHSRQMWSIDRGLPPAGLWIIASSDEVAELIGEVE